MLDKTNSAAQALAGEAYGAFEQRKRGDETITCLRDDAPQWIRDAVYNAHGGMFPDDWRYDKTQEAFGAIHDANDNADLQEVADQFCDDAVDVYTNGRLQWLASDLSRPSYCDDAVSEGLSDGSDVVETIGLGQYMEAREIFGAVWRALEDELEARELDSDDDDSEGA